MSNLELEELAIKTTNRLEFKERNGLQIKLVADYKCQPTMNEYAVQLVSTSAQKSIRKL